MSAITSRCTNHLSALQRPVPIADGLALHWNNAVSCLTPHRIMWGIRFKWRYRTAAQQSLPRLIVTPSVSPIGQIPIDL